MEEEDDICSFDGDTRNTAYSLFWNTLTKGSGVLCHSSGHTGSLQKTGYVHSVSVHVYSYLASALRSGSSASQTSVRAQPPLSVVRHQPACSTRYCNKTGYVYILYREIRGTFTWTLSPTRLLCTSSLDLRENTVYTFFVRSRMPTSS